MNRCEDYPFCGHDLGECPNHDGTFNCVSCNKRLPLNATSSLCYDCYRRLIAQDNHSHEDRDLI